MTDEEIETEVNWWDNMEYEWGWLDAQNGSFCAPGGEPFETFYMAGYTDYKESVR